MFQVLDLFSGIGGFSLGLERTQGFKTVAFCEIEPYPRALLARHWPDVPCYEDVKNLNAETLQRNGISPDVICGGFPCQDISTAGRGAGLGGARSGLWFEYARLIGELRPRYVIVENVSALLVRGIDQVLGSLAEIGYDAEWHCIPAAAASAPHRRDRLWIIAYQEAALADSGKWRDAERQRDSSIGIKGEAANVPDAECKGLERRNRSKNVFRDGSTIAVRNSGTGTKVMANANPSGRSTRGKRRRAPGTSGEDQRGIISDTARGVGDGSDNNSGSYGIHAIARTQEQSGNQNYFGSIIRRQLLASQWQLEPDVGRVVNGVSAFMDRLNGIPIDDAPISETLNGKTERLKGLGNAVIPQIPEIIGNAILEFERHRNNGFNEAQIRDKQ